MAGKREPKQTAKRYRLVQDDDSHWYAIPADSAAAFETWVTAMESDGPYQGEDFDSYRLGSHPSAYTFERWMRDAKS